MPPLLIVNGGNTVGQVFRRALTKLPLTQTGTAAKAAARSEHEKKCHPTSIGWHFLFKLLNVGTVLLQLSEVLDGANHLRGVRVLIVVPSNNLNERVAVANLADHGLVSVEQ